ncbi:hypothetical protein ACFE04_031881 [Oxalis oulophora]
MKNGLRSTIKPDVDDEGCSKVKGFDLNQDLPMDGDGDGDGDADDCMLDREDPLLTSSKHEINTKLLGDGVGVVKEEEFSDNGDSKESENVKKRSKLDDGGVDEVKKKKKKKKVKVDDVSSVREVVTALRVLRPRSGVKLDVDRTENDGDDDHSERGSDMLIEPVKRKRGRPPMVLRQHNDGAESSRNVKAAKVEGGENIERDRKKVTRKVKGKKRGRPPKAKLLDADCGNAKGEKPGRFLKMKTGDLKPNKSGKELGDSELGRKGKQTSSEKERRESEVGQKVRQSRSENERKENELGPISNKVKVDKGHSRREEKKVISDRILEIIFAAGWKVEYRPRNGRDYRDAVYVCPGGKTHWSVTKAYRSFLQYNEGLPEENKFTFTPISPEDLSILQKVVTKKRSDTNKPRSKGSDDEYIVTEKRKKKKVHKEKFNIVAKTKGKVKKKKTVFPGKYKSASASDNKAKASRNLKRSETQKRKRYALLARGSMEGPESENGGYVLHDGKRTVLTWMIDMGTVQLNGKVRYSKLRSRHGIREGKITREGIICNCCNEIFTVSNFAIHAGGKLAQPFQNIYLETGTSLMQCLLESWNKQDESELKGFHFLDVSGEDPSDDTCGLCGDGGDLICCDGCPSTFHQSCLNIKKFPSGDWHCVYCSCKFCGIVDEDSAASEILTCCLCEEKYHKSCIEPEDAISNDCSGSSFCGRKCQELFEKLQMVLGVKHELPDGFSCTFVRRFDSDISVVETPMKVECNSKLAVALLVMDECFLPLSDYRTSVNLIHNIVYNFGSNFNRLNYSGFLTAILERGDEIISAASIRIHGTYLAEMPFIGTRYAYRRQGMCRRFLNGIESVLGSLNIENLVIPAISELRETWTSVFGFKPIDQSSKQKMRKMNMLMFPGVDVLQKPLLLKKPSEKDLVLAEGLDQIDLNEEAIITEVADTTDEKISAGCELNVLGDENVLQPCEESGTQHPCISKHDEMKPLTLDVDILLENSTPSSNKFTSQNLSKTTDIPCNVDQHEVQAVNGKQESPVKGNDTLEAQECSMDNHYVEQEESTVAHSNLLTATEFASQNLDQQEVQAVNGKQESPVKGNDTLEAQECSMDNHYMEQEESTVAHSNLLTATEFASQNLDQQEVQAVNGKQESPVKGNDTLEAQECSMDNHYVEQEESTVAHSNLLTATEFASQNLDQQEVQAVNGKQESPVKGNDTLEAQECSMDNHYVEQEESTVAHSNLLTATEFASQNLDQQEVQAVNGKQESPVKGNDTLETQECSMDNQHVEQEESNVTHSNLITATENFASQNLDQQKVQAVNGKQESPVKGNDTFEAQACSMDNNHLELEESNVAHSNLLPATEKFASQNISKAVDILCNVVQNEVHAVNGKQDSLGKNNATFVPPKSSMHDNHVVEEKSNVVHSDVLIAKETSVLNGAQKSTEHVKCLVSDLEVN